MRRGRTTARCRTSGSSSSGTASSSSRSRERSSTASRKPPKGAWRRSARTSSPATAAPQVAKELGLGDRLLEYAGDIPSDELQRISRSRNVLAAVLEAAIAALYIEHGFERIEPAIVAAFGEKIEYARSSHVDYKTELQEALARSGKQVHYTVLEVEGPPHDRRFVCAAHVAGVQLGVGRGSTKKAAEQEAARQALEALGVVPEQI